VERLRSIVACRIDTPLWYIAKALRINKILFFVFLHQKYLIKASADLPARSLLPIVSLTCSC